MQKRTYANSKQWRDDDNYRNDMIALVTSCLKQKVIDLTDAATD